MQYSISHTTNMILELVFMKYNRHPQQENLLNAYDVSQLVYLVEHELNKKGFIITNAWYYSNNVVTNAYYESNYPEHTDKNKHIDSYVVENEKNSPFVEENIKEMLPELLSMYKDMNIVQRQGYINSLVQEEMTAMKQGSYVFS